MKKKTVLNVLMILCLLIAFGCGGYLAYYYYQSSKSEGLVDDLRSMIVENEDTTNQKTDEMPESEGQTPYEEYTDVNGKSILKKFEKLYRDNSDLIGWIHIDDTNIDYPVMYTSWDKGNGEYYIHRDYNEDYSAAGTPFVDANCSINPATDNIIVYGHNMNSGKMFHDLLKYEDKDFYESHKTFTFDTIYGEGTYEVVAIIRGQILPDESGEFKYYEFVNAGSKEDFDSYITNIKRMSQIETNIDVEYGDKLVTLSTCAYHVQDGRFAVIAKKVEES